ncbi:hypothetical protein COCNU_scaffold000478G000070 [Cocos nucifera]|nr:hypothetical protein [Cocos nucifera]
MLSPALSDEAIPFAPIRQERAVEKKKKKTIGKKVRRKAKSFEERDLGQEQGSLDDREVVQALMEGSILPHIVERMHQKDDIERFDKSFAAFLELGHYLFAHSKAVSQNQAEASKALEEAHIEAEKARADADILKIALETHSSEVECLQNELREERGEIAKLRAELALEKEEKRKAQEEVSTAMERVMQNLKSSKDMEDIKIDFAQKVLLKGFQVYMGRVAENFSNIDLDLLLEEPEDRASPSCIDAEVAPESAGAASEPTQGSKPIENVPTSLVSKPPKV